MLRNNYAAKTMPRNEAAAVNGGGITPGPRKRGSCLPGSAKNMPAKLTWDDLLIQNIDPAEAARCLGMWGDLIHGRVAPVFMSKFGDWFLRRPDGGTLELSVIEGTLETVAETPEEFTKLVNTQDWQELHLFSLQVYDLHQRGLVPAPGQCYGLAPHPASTGKIDLSTAMIMDIPVWQSICAQLFSPKRTGAAELGGARSNGVAPPLDDSGGVERPPSES